MHYAGTALSGLPGNRDGYGVLVPDTATVDWDSADDLRTTIERIGPDRVAAFFCEPVIGAGGVFPPPEGYLADVRKICTEYDVLFVADEVVTGYGRIGGSWFASTRFGLEPDIVTTAKGLSPAGTCRSGRAVAPKVAEPFFKPGWRGVVAARLHLLRPRDGLRGGARQPGDHRAGRTARRGNPAGVDSLATRLGHHWLSTSGWRRCAAGPGRWPRSSCASRARPPAARQDPEDARGGDPGGRRRWDPDLPTAGDDGRAGRRSGQRHRRRAGRLTAFPTRSFPRVYPGCHGRRFRREGARHE